MAEEITRRLLLKQDIDFDTDGTGGTVNVSNPAGGTIPGNKLNASHIPVTTVIRQLMSGTANIEDVLVQLYENFSNAGGAASTDKKGIIEIATLLEAKAGTDTVKAITPYLLKNVKATAEQFGTLKLATPAEAVAGTETEKAVTPAGLSQRLEALDLPINLEYGMILSINDTDPNTVQMSPGVISDSTHTYMIPCIMDFRKKLNATWIPGEGNGGRAAGVALSPNTWYHDGAIYNPTQKIADKGFDTALDFSNLLADANAQISGYTHYRYLGSVLTDSNGDIIPGVWRDLGGHGIKFDWDSSVVDYAGAITTKSLITVRSPLDIKTETVISWKTSTSYSDRFYYFWDPDLSSKPATPNAACQHASSGGHGAGEVNVLTNISSQIAVGDGGGIEGISCLGYKYTR